MSETADKNGVIKLPMTDADREDQCKLALAELVEAAKALVMCAKNDVRWISSHGGAENPITLAIIKNAEAALAKARERL